MALQQHAGVCELTTNNGPGSFQTESRVSRPLELHPMNAHVIANRRVHNTIVLASARHQNDRNLMFKAESHGRCRDRTAAENEDLINFGRRNLQQDVLILLYQQSFILTSQQAALL